MKVRILGSGTSQGIPVIGCSCDVCLSNNPKDKRFRSSVMIEYKKQTILIDCCPDFRMQYLTSEKKDLCSILLTHEHKDHTGGLDDIRPICYFQKKCIPIYGLKRTIENIKKDYRYIFQPSDYKGLPQVETHDIFNQQFYIKDIAIQPLVIMHHKLKILGYRINDFVYITDCKTIPKETLPYLSNIKVLIINSLQRKPHISHLTLEEALQWVKELKPQKTFLTHISHNLGKHNQVQEELPSHIKPAYDNMEIEV